ncbi:hypothetical protein NQ129_08060 [Priestia aryabhattai]|uniref:hypothetical protein n=1 Tax=Priestia aryabhattai TaxID=412384 RepID=UPI00211C79A7|nr:hypothetical protein [Priestia aryabhattai]MCQ9281728.1 hypothetical protein [Priestia aryabhattai]
MTNLASALAKHMEYELTKLSYLTALLDDEGVTYKVLPWHSKVKILIDKPHDGLSFEIETCEYGYKLSPVYVSEMFGRLEFKKIERVYAETIIENIKRISENRPQETFKHIKRKRAWEKKRKLLHKKEYLNDLKRGVVV